MSVQFNRQVLDFDAETVAATTERAIVTLTGRVLKRRGVVLGVSGGVDSAVCLSLALRALGPDRVVALLMPEQETEDEDTARAAALCQELEVPFLIEEIGPALEALGCYERRDAAIRDVFPDYGAGYKQKVTIAASLLDSDRVNFFNLTVESPSGEQTTRRMGASAYSSVVAATNMKQRARKLIEYFHAESRNYAVLGTPNRLEYELGFFVRGGDGLADLKPIAHLFKTQVYGLAAYLGLPVAIREQPASTGTYTLPQTQEEFYFALPHKEMDLLLWAWEHEIPPDEAGAVMGLEARQVERVYRDIESKRRAAARGLAGALLVEPVALPDHP